MGVAQGVTWGVAQVVAWELAKGVAQKVAMGGPGGSHGGTPWESQRGCKRKA